MDSAQLMTYAIPLCISTIELFSGVAMRPKLKHYHSFGCPTYVLDKALQAQKTLPKWQSMQGSASIFGPIAKSLTQREFGAQPSN